MAKKDFGAVANIIKNTTNGSIPEMDINKIIPNENNFFSMEHDAEYKLLFDSIKENGVLHPIVLAKVSDNQYKIISGERRYRASVELGKKTIPYTLIPENVDADIALVDTNFCARSLSASDYAKAIDFLEMKLKNQADISGRIRDHIGSILGLSGKQVQRYKAYNNLVPELQEKVDNSELGMSAVAQLASLPEEKQKEAVEKIEVLDPSEKKDTRTAVKKIKKDILSKKEPEPEIEIEEAVETTVIKNEVEGKESSQGNVVNTEDALKKATVKLENVLKNHENDIADKIRLEVIDFIKNKVDYLDEIEIEGSINDVVNASFIIDDFEE